MSDTPHCVQTACNILELVSHPDSAGSLAAGAEFADGNRHGRLSACSAGPARGNLRLGFHDGSVCLVWLLLRSPASPTRREGQLRRRAPCRCRIGFVSLAVAGDSPAERAGRRAPRRGRIGVCWRNGWAGSAKQRSGSRGCVSTHQSRTSARSRIHIHPHADILFMRALRVSARRAAPRTDVFNASHAARAGCPRAAVRGPLAPTVLPEGGVAPFTDQAHTCAPYATMLVNSCIDRDTHESQCSSATDPTLMMVDV